MHAAAATASDATAELKNLFQSALNEPATTGAGKATRAAQDAAQSAPQQAGTATAQYAADG